MSTPKPLTDGERAANKKAMAQMEADRQTRDRAAEVAEAKQLDEAKEKLLGQMDTLIPRSERSEFTGKSRAFQFPADAWERVYGKKKTI